ncbi:MAG: amidohydrolase family protein [Gemmatimonadota bacterium]
MILPPVRSFAIRTSITATTLAVIFCSPKLTAQDRQPTIPPPTIVEYHPRSRLVVPQHPVPRAKYPAVDVHGHPPRLDNAATIRTVLAAMDSLNIGVMVQANGTSGERLTGQIAAVKAAGLSDRFVFFTTLDLGVVKQGDGVKLAEQLKRDVAAGAVGIGELNKGFGLSARGADGARLHLDDPELDIVWETAADLGVPVFIHTADPAAFFEPLDFTNERWLEMALFPSRRFNDRSRFPTFDTLMAERERMIAKHPRTTWILAHMGWYADDLAKLGRLFDKYPNVNAEVGAILYDLGRQPRTAHDFFVMYQDRILFGKDSFQPSEYPYYWRVFETADEYFDYYRDYHAFWKLYGLDLPDVVLKKLYQGNAERIIPNLPHR